MVFKNSAMSRQIVNNRTSIKSVTKHLGVLGRLRQLNALFGQAIKDHARSTAGNITLFAALAAVPVFGSLGLAVDYLRVSKAAADMQFAADSAALAAASASNITGTPAQDAAARQTIALKYLNAELASLEDVVVNSSPTVSVADNTVNIELNASVRGSFINALNAVKKDAAEIGTISDVGAVSTGKISTITVKSHAKWKTSGAPACITTLDPTASESFYLNSSSELNAPSCDVNVLSTSNTAAKVISASSTTFRRICVKGGTSGTLAGLTANCTPGGDMFAGTMPAVTVPTTCNSSGATLTNATITPPPAGYVFCGNNALAGGGVTTLNPGLYIIKNGLLTLSAKTVHGTGVTFYFASNTSDLNYVSKEDNYLKAPVTGPYAGLLMFQAPGLPAQNVTIGSADKSVFEGIIYAPKWNLTMNSTSDWSTVGTSRINMVVNTFRGISISKLAITNYVATPAGSAARTVALK